ncbi:hypothetical protein JZ751_003675, partial [Albula glossodonta]
RPRVRLLHNTHPETGEVRVSCLATGFYPRHIKLTMLRDGHPIPEEELILGALLPNGDGTYQLRRTLSVGAEELRERHHYTCSVTHLTLDNKLDIGWEPEHGPNILVIIAVVMVVVLTLIFTVPAFVLLKRRLKGSKTSPRPVYTAAAVHVYQKRAGCVLDGDRESPAMMWDACDGTEALSYDMQKYTFNPLWPQFEWDSLTKQAVLIDFKDIYLPLCIKTLKKEKHVVLRKERPKVSLLRKEGTGEMRVSCLATGFYPRHINLTMLRDGHPIPEEELILGDLLPNGDGTYQLRRTLSVGAEELRERHHYTCSVTHITLDNKPDISLEPDDGPNITIIIIVVVVLLLVILVILTVFIKRRREHPRIELLHNTHSETGRVKLSCLATGFYPRHINMTMLRDGHPIPEEELILGDLLPNGDGTYQLRRTLSVGAEEPRERHHYTCSVTHLTLDNKLDIGWGSHSLWVFSTLIHGETQFPEFSTVFIVDDVQVLYYNGNIWKFNSWLQQNSEDRDDEAIHTDVKLTAERVYNRMKGRLYQLNVLNNQTRGIHVYQKMTRCELHNDTESPVKVWDAYDGTEARTCSLKDYTFNPQWPVLMLNKGQLDTLVMDLMYVLQPSCIQTLKHYLKKVKNVAQRKERPRVRLLHNTHPETGGVKLSCLATGFYPQHINLTMLRDGHPIPEEELILGDLLPNGDGTYQLRRTLSVGAEELRERHHYTCSVTHLSLDNKLDIGWEPAYCLNTPVINTMVLALIFSILAFVFYKKRPRERCHGSTLRCHRGISYMMHVSTPDIQL